MIPLLATSLCIVFCFLGLLHFYWAAGGEWALADAMTPKMWAAMMKPGKQTGFRVLTVFVGFGLLAMGGIMLSNWLGGLPDFLEPFLKWVTLGVSGVFTVRAIGNFKDVGLFQGGTSSEFARRDKRIYSPLCIVLAVGAFVLWWMG